MNVRQASSRRAGGATRSDRRILRIVEAATQWPSRRSSPWICTTPHQRFSLARRSTSAMTSSEIRGRPDGLGWHRFAATSRRCQRSSVPGVTIRCPRSALGRTRASAASTARSGQVIFGFGFPRRRIATSCRSASISASLNAEERASSTSHDSSVVQQPAGHGGEHRHRSRPRQSRRSSQRPSLRPAQAAARDAAAEAPCTEARRRLERATAHNLACTLNSPHKVSDLSRAAQYSQEAVPSFPVWRNHR